MPFRTQKAMTIKEKKYGFYEKCIVTVLKTNLFLWPLKQQEKTGLVAKFTK